MKIGIHHRPGSFSDRWIEYCKLNDIPHKIVNCYSDTIIKDLEECSGLMWHWHQSDYKAVLFARQLTFALERIGKKVFPDSNTAWHFDDKVGQKYLFEALEAPLVPSHVFYSKKEALEWLEDATFPMVFKLRGGAGSRNVRLIKNKKSAITIINRAFREGFSASNRINDLTDRLRILKRKGNAKALIGVLKGIVRLALPNEFEYMHGREKGYVYFQDFMKFNKYDTRVIVIGDKCFAIRRYNRKNDFRASGSGLIGYEPELFDKRCIKMAFEISTKLKSQSTSFDFIFDAANNPIVVEISYAFTSSVYNACPGFWNRDLVWREGKFIPQYFMIEQFLESIAESKVLL